LRARCPLVVVERDFHGAVWAYDATKQSIIVIRRTCSYDEVQGMSDKISDVVAWRAFKPANGAHVAMTMYLHKIAAQHEQNEAARGVLRKVAVPAGSSRMDVDSGSTIPASESLSATPPAPEESERADPETPAAGEQKPRRKRRSVPEQPDEAVVTPPAKPRRSDCDCYNCQHPSWKRKCLGTGGTKADADRDNEERKQRQKKSREDRAGEKESQDRQESQVEAVAMARTSHEGNVAVRPGRDTIRHWMTIPKTQVVNIGDD